MSEQTPPIKHPDLSGLPRGAISIRGLPIGRNTRLPSIRSPRDLTLGAQPKRVFTPKIPVRRDKKVEPKPENPQTPPLNAAKEVKKNSKSKWQKKERVIIQTEGSLFGEGIAASMSKNERKETVPKFAPKKTFIKKEKDLSDIDSGINDLLRDDFIDDDDEYDENQDVKPIIYPIQNSTEKIKSELAPKQSFEDEEFAKGLNFDVEKIARFIKKEKCPDISNTQEDLSVETKVDNEMCDAMKKGLNFDVEKVARFIKKEKCPDVSDKKENLCMETKIGNEMHDIMKKDKDQLFLLQFPKLFAAEHMDDHPKNSSSSTEQKNVKSKIKTGLRALPEGRIGKLQVMKSGRTRLVIGENTYYLDFSNPLKSKHEVLSIQADTNEKDMVVIGNIDYKATVIPDVDKLLRSAR